MNVRASQLLSLATLLVAACTTPSGTDAGDIAPVDATDAVDRATPDVIDVVDVVDVIDAAPDVIDVPDVQDVVVDTVPTCAAPMTFCGTDCVDTQSDATHCGSCDIVCAADQTCNAGSCECPTGQMLCGTGSAAHCVDTQTDNANCGACDMACPSVQTCTAGSCACAGGAMLCGTGSAVACVDLQTDATNCGACGTTCSSVQTCATGACACRATAEVLDQSQLAAFGGQGVPYPTVIGQTFRVDRTGALTAIEARLTATCPADQGAILTLYRGTTAIGTARLSCAQIGTANAALSATSRTAVVFDLSASCPSVTMGETLEFRIAPDAPAPAAGSCVVVAPGFGMCAGSGTFCMNDNGCSTWSMGVGNTNGNPYPYGDMFYGGGVETNVDMSFKTFIR